MKDCTISTADALVFLGHIEDNGIDLLLTDVPYGVCDKPSGLYPIDKGDANTETFDLTEFAEEAVRVTKQNSVIFCAREQVGDLLSVFNSHGLLTRLIVWEKTNPSPMNCQHTFVSGLEVAVYFRKSNATFNGHYLNTVFKYPKGTADKHPTEKPLNLFKQLVEILSNTGDLVCDPCVGSGTTAVASYELKRGFMGVDINPIYVELAKKRLNDAHTFLF